MGALRLLALWLQQQLQAPAPTVAQRQTQGTLLQQVGTQPPPAAAVAAGGRRGRRSAALGELVGRADS